MQHILHTQLKVQYVWVLSNFSVCFSRVYQEARGRLAAVSNWFCVQVNFKHYSAERESKAEMAPREEQTQTSESSQKEEKNKTNKKKQRLNNLLYYTEILAFEYFILV